MKRAILQEILRKCHDQLQRGSHPQKDNFIHWTFLVRDNHIISSGVNRPVEPAQHFGYHRAFFVKGDDSPVVPKWHSELDAIKKSRGKAFGCTTVNVRLNKRGDMRMSMPCIICHRLLYAIGVKKCFFSTSLGWASITL